MVFLLKCRTTDRPSEPRRDYLLHDSMAELFAQETYMRPIESIKGNNKYSPLSDRQLVPLQQVFCSLSSPFVIVILVKEGVLLIWLYGSCLVSGK